MENNLQSIENLQFQIIQLISKGKILFQDNKIDQAFIFFNKALQLNKNYAEIYLDKGERCMKNLHIKKGEKYIKKYIRIKQDIYNSYLDMVEIYIIHQNYTKALNLCNNVIGQNLIDYKIYHKKAYILIQLNKINESLKYYDKCIELQPNYYDAYCEKADILTGLCKHEEALKTYSDAIKINNLRIEGFIGSALVYVDLGDYLSALPFMENAYKLNPNDNWCKLYYNIIKNSIDKKTKLKKNGIVIPLK